MGSALGAMRFVEARYPGKRLRAVLDGELRGPFRDLDRDQRILRPDAIAGERFDLVVLVDGSARNGLGGAETFLDSAQRVLVIDHHQGEDLGLEPGRLIRLIDPSRDATCEILAELISALALPPRLGARERAAIALPLAVGMHTDTRGLTKPGTLTRTRERYDALVRDHLGGEPALVAAAATGRVSAAAMALFSRTPQFVGRLSGPSGAELRGLYRAQGSPHIEVEFERIIDQSWQIVTVPAALVNLALDVARFDLRNAQLNLDDLLGWIFDWYEQSSFADLSVLLVEHADGVRVSCRSSLPAPAVKLAESLGGGGRAGVAGCRTPIPASLDEVRERARKWFYDTYGPLLEEILARSARGRSPRVQTPPDLGDPTESP
ncbi:MAG: hypothetical protein IT384_02710 [Deltaproteobacteria bacterium]|nr:hypothetical protein [Deltaproteobacteria bacterium]